MYNKRVIASVQLDNQEVVKSYQFGERAYIGEPTNIIRIFNDKLVDELVVFDISNNINAPDFEFLSQLTSEAFMPMSYAGKIRNIEHVARLFTIGFEKVIFNYSAITNRNLLKQAINHYGRQSIAVCVDVLENNGTYNLYYPNINSENLSLKAYLKELSILNVGEIIIQSVNKDGTQSGVSSKFIDEFCSFCKIPLIYCGGVKSSDDIKLVLDSGFSGCLVGSYFCQYGKHKAALISYIGIDSIYDSM
jgi:cyclase